MQQIIFPPPPPPPINTSFFDEIDNLSDIDIDNSVESLPEEIEVKDLIVKQEDKDNVDYLCAICKGFMLPDTCIELKCGHLFCKNCIYNVNNTISLSAKCPLCNKKSNTFKYIKNSNQFAYKILSSVKIRCPNEGCTKELLAGDLKYHFKKCEYDLIDCEYCDKKNIYRKDLKCHLTENMEDHFLKLIEEVSELKKKLKINK